MDQQFLENLYLAFNDRRFDDLLTMMHPDVAWENGMQGGFVHGRAAVSEYWRKQFEFITTHLDPLKFETDADGRSVISLHITVSDLAGKTLLQKDIKHIFTFRDGLIAKFEIADTNPVFANEGFDEISDKFSSRMDEAD